MTIPAVSGTVSGNAGAGHAQTASDGFELGDVLRILAERRKIIIMGGVLGLILGIVATMMMTSMYRASVTLELNPNSTEMIDSAASVRGQAPARGQTQEMMATQIGLLLSETLARRVVEDLNLASDPAFGGSEGTRQQRIDRAVAILRAYSSAENVKGSMLINVSHVSSDPETAAKVANALAKGFIAASLERRYDASSYAREFLSDQLARTKASLEEADRALNAYAIRTNLFRLPGIIVDGRTSEGTTLAAADLIQLNTALNGARVNRILADQTYRNAGIEFVSEQAASARVSSQVHQRSDLQAQYAEKLRLFKPDYPQMQEMQARIAQLDATINAARAKFTSDKRDELRGNFEAAVRSETALMVKVAEAKAEVQGERSRSIQYNILQREADTNRALYDALLQRYKEVGVAGGIGQSMVSIVDAAEPPPGPYSPRLLVNLMVGLMLGLVGGIGLAFAFHLLFDAIIDPVDVRQKLHLPVLGVIPMDDEDRTLMEALADRKSDISEAYYSVRTALKFSRPEGAPRTLLVTSTRPGEGKSTSAFAIASSMARLGTRVLLIDADLRKPTFVSSREDGYGLAHLLGTEEPLSSYVEATQAENLTLLPVGRFVGSAAELLSSNRLPAIIFEAREAYDMVVIDGPPVLGLTDAPLLSSVAEATALVVESRESRTSNVSEMVRRLSEAGATIIGVILTKVTSNGSSYGYYSYSYGSDGVGGRVSSDPARALDLNAAEN